MNAMPDLDFWGRLMGVLFVQITVLVFLVEAITRWLAGGRGRKWCWRAVFAMAGCWLIAAATGIERGVTKAANATPPTERQFVVRHNMPVHSVGSESSPERSVIAESTPVPALLRAEREPAGAVWWPAIVWLGVSVFLWMRLAIGQGLIAWYARRQGRGVSRALDALVNRVSERLGVGNRVVVCVMPELVSPVTHGWWRARIALPTRFEHRYREEEQEAILSHELAHVTARDPLWIAVSDLVTAALWWHPLIWWGQWRLRQTTEQAADEASAAIEGGPAVLAECLVELAGRLQRPATPGWLGIHGHDFRSGLGRRVRHLLEWRGVGWRPRPRRSQVMAMTLAGVAAVVLGVFAPGWLLPRLHADERSLLEHVAAAVGPEANTDLEGRQSEVRQQTGTPRRIDEESTDAHPKLLTEIQPPTVERASGDPALETAPSGPAAEGPTKSNLVATASDSTSSAQIGEDPPSSADLWSLTYRVDVHRLRLAFEALSAGDQEPAPLAVALRQYLNAAGVDFGTTNALVGFNDSGRAWQSSTGRSFLFNELNGRLLIRATADEHILTNMALGMLLPVSQQITIEAKIIEVIEPLQLGFDWFLGNQLMTAETNVHSSVATITGIMTDPMFTGLPMRSYSAEVPGDELDWAGRSDPDARRMQVISSEESPLTRILDDAQLKALLSVLERQAGTDLLAAPRVTTLSGRQTEISLLELRSVVVGIKPEARVEAEDPPGSPQNSGPFRTGTFPCGPVLDVIPNVAADGQTIELEVKFTLTEALGYAEDRASEQTQVWDHGRKTRVIAPIPRFRVRKMSASASLADGQTLVMLGGPAEDIVRTKDKVPVLGDIPLVGQLFRSEQEGRITKRLFVLITAIQIDPAGNRLHPAVSAVAPVSEPHR